MPSHKFHVGEIVSIRPEFSRNVPGGLYEIIKQLPKDGGEFQYQVKNVGEPYQRVVRENELTKT